MIALSRRTASDYPQRIRTETLERSCDWEDLGPFVEHTLRAVQVDVPGWSMCRARRDRHRAWIEAFVLANLERRVELPELLPPLVHLSLLVSYDEGIMLRVFAHTMGMGLGSARVRHPEGELAIWEAGARGRIRNPAGRLRPRAVGARRHSPEDPGIGPQGLAGCGPSVRTPCNVRPTGSSSVPSTCSPR